MIDLHAHVLPGLDDGPPDLDGCVALARAAVAAGTTVMATTSHVDHSFGVDPARLAGERERVQAALDAAGVPLQLVRGGEIGLLRLLELSDDELRELRLGDGPCLLVEAPLSPAVADVVPVVDDLRRRGFRTLIAHPERCPAFLREPGRVDELVDAGALVQLTAGSLRGQFGTTVQRFSLRLLEAGTVHCVSSDAHDARHRPPGIADALEQVGAGALVHALCVTGPQAILAGRAPAEVGPWLVPRRRGLFARFRA